MTVKFFGQFLLERGELDDYQLRIALDLMEQENQTVGELAVEQGFATQAECRRVHGEQRRKDLPWGELAVQMGALNNVELDELLQMQRRTRLPLAAALVRLEMIPPDRVRALHDEFKSAEVEEEPEGLLAGPYAANLAAVATARLLPRLLRRVGGVEGALSNGRELDALPDAVLVASIPLVGLHGLRITMLVERTLAEKLAGGLLGFELGDLASELALDGVGEFLNVLAGNVVSSLDDEAVELRLEPPCYGVLPTSGYLFDIETESSGKGTLILELPPDGPERRSVIV